MGFAPFVWNITKPTKWLFYSNPASNQIIFLRLFSFHRKLPLLQSNRDKERERNPGTFFLLGYNFGAKLLTDFFRKELAKFLKPMLYTLGRRIIECSLTYSDLQEYLSFFPMIFELTRPERLHILPK